MLSWGRSGRTGRDAIVCAVMLTMAVWFSPPAISLSHAIEGQAPVLVRAVEPDELQGRPDAAPWGPVAPRIKPPEVAPGTRMWPQPGDGFPLEPTDDRLVEKLVEWILLAARDEEQPFRQIADFIKENPDWPRMGALRNKAERSITPDDNDGSVLTWFRAFPPRTVQGAIAHAAALERIGKKDEAVAVLRRAWMTFDMKAADEKMFISRFGRHLESEHHWARLDRLLWNNRRSAANRQIGRVGKDYRKLAEVRLLLMRRRGNAGKAMKTVPKRLKTDQGLIYEWVRWNRRKENNDVAIAALLAFEGKHSHPKRWWTERQILARRALLDGDSKTAYRLIREHGLSRGVARADAEFLAGWIALRFLGKSRTAFEHFSHLYDDVRYPISRARAAYWSGRAAEAAGEQQIARQWFQTAARNTTTFYGQLAARRVGLDVTPVPSREPEISPVARVKFERDELARVARILVSLRDAPPSEKPAAKGKPDPHDDPRAYLATLNLDTVLKRFLRHIARQSDTAEEWSLAAQLARDSGRIDVAVYIARRAARDEVVLGELGYPTMVLAEGVPPEPALLHAVIRQESAFDASARSRAGARGLMQLMPATAKNVARRLKVKGHSTARLTSDPHHNVALGSAYLDSMLARYEGSMIMALAAYNAGPHRVDRWLEDYGDPRGSLNDAIDWIESIPFSETRNYVQRIMEALPIYRQKLNGAQVAVLRAEDIAGRLPGYATPIEP